MRFVEMALAFAALGFVAANVALSLVTVWIWRTARGSDLDSASLFALRMLPSVGSLVLVIGVVLPAFWAFEPRGTAERAGPVLVAFFFLAVAIVATGLRRAFVGWAETRRLERRWRSEAVGGATAVGPFVAYRVPAEQPLAALVGLMRPRLFASDRLLNALSPTEWQAVIEHETGHLVALDNLKRAVMRVAPDALAYTRTGREIERAWAVAAEEAADDRVVGSDRARSLDLAGALLKASRLAPLRYAEFSNFCDDSTIVRRVRRLLADTPLRPIRSRSRAARWAGFVAAGILAALFAGPGLRASYALTEAAVRLLQ